MWSPCPWGVRERRWWEDKRGRTLAARRDGFVSDDLWLYKVHGWLDIGYGLPDIDAMPWLWNYDHHRPIKCELRYTKPSIPGATFILQDFYAQQHDTSVNIVVQSSGQGFRAQI